MVFMLAQDLSPDIIVCSKNVVRKVDKEAHPGKMSQNE